MLAVRFFHLILIYSIALILTFNSGQQHPFLAALFMMIVIAASMLIFYLFIKISVILINLVDSNFLKSSDNILYGYLLGALGAIFGTLGGISLSNVLLDFLNSLN